METFYKHASRSAVCNVSLPLDVLRMIRGFASASEELQTCCVCKRPVVELHREWMATTGANMEWRLAGNCLVRRDTGAQRMPCPHTRGRGDEKHLTLHRSPHLLTFTPSVFRVGDDLRFANVFERMHMVCPFFVLSDRAHCATCWLMRRRLKRVLRLWRCATT